ncbi:hypothetical protein AVEN_145117-1 [Araneus ventricosus]|uniref:Uncharacterized protein n=1 Tax=Araneus ventricosus TaxID=182803 RepID=A0A4Y2JGH7_ARAVE|nr:hypothetical protein AVEN_145117-1 [Araneus ventricosus]
MYSMLCAMKYFDTLGILKVMNVMQHIERKLCDDDGMCSLRIHRFSSQWTKLSKWKNVLTDPIGFHRSFVPLVTRAGEGFIVIVINFQPCAFCRTVKSMSYSAES